ncbi:MAG: septal ring lytic transglycosylase RlpA family protein [Pseudomonadota bacterium]|nr:septal ring lytic transglycosylase RlpA family protein [Gammaproteobacteria bacterium]MBU1927168.1 septal ring lytic transglycosylase RlpA family protein [Gammaproteobacteria bacterium]MBU2546580.1 septal ring lytic transglycosylase RlpA family protein [Gammaproteobacteria bacterium]
MKFIVLFTLALLLTACSSSQYFEPQDGPPQRTVDVSTIPNATPKKEPHSRYGNPPYYTVYGETYHVMPSSQNYVATGVASWYGTKFNHQLTSDHEEYDMLKMTAAHKTLPLPTYVKVTNLKNHRSIIVKVNDRGPFEKNRLIDLSYVAAKKLDILRKGTGLVKIVALNPGALHNVQPVYMAKKSANKIQTLYLQVGAYGERMNAEKMLKRVKDVTTLPSQIYASRNSKEMLYRVQIGPMRDAETSNFVMNTLEEAGIHSAKTVIQEKPSALG